MELESSEDANKTRKVSLSDQLIEYHKEFDMAIQYPCQDTTLKKWL